MADGKVIDIEQKVPDFREQRRRKSRRRLVLYISILAFFLLFVYYFQSDYSTVGHVDVYGTDMVDEKWVVESSGLTDGVSMWSYPFHEAVEELMEHPVIVSVEAERNWPRSITLYVDEYRTVGYLRSAENGAFYPLLNDGSILNQEEFQGSHVDEPLISGMDAHSELGRLAHELDELDEMVTRRISEVVHEPDQGEHHLTLYTTDGFTVYTEINDFASNMTAYPAVAIQLNPEEEGILHMRMTPYFEREGQEEEEIEIEE
ncbi:cell division protein FtsQ/DivIB [Salisediminibacterium selenitireducens]|uniref:Cell division protein DivIB n=1 Tax=Bacillus selenitireducens (strain ATCC 700615 / DSM 15326 / MLS10) TaxID=439292 RepID=DIVIB_BACIE|nr:cell division protein FtsQ/DivIB [Salisediminibacterium selenitireducens]D6XTM9.1 RecName: Full=Cell division protein DivIB [[Bacillus] selenitireducens MLS10]ADH99165.1 cell division protein FtsQ [[Bacillus] selenitireducens MLS10]